MNDEIHAIYEHGILRPLTHLDLPESAEVAVTVRYPIGNGKQPMPADPLLGLMADEPELVDQAVQAAMAARELHPLRAST